MWILDKLRSRSNTIRFEELSVEWLALKKTTIKQSTYYKYAYCIDKYLKDRIGRLRKKDLEKYDFNQMTNDLTKELSPKSVKEILNVLKSILKYANQKYDMNIHLDLIISPKVRAKDISVLSKKEINRLEKYCLKENSLKSLGILICLNTGLRIGEICALRWENIDFEKKLIYIKKTLQRVYTVEKKTEIIIDSSKTESSIRSIPMSDKIYHILKDVHNKQSEKAFFLTGTRDQYIEPRSYQNMFKRILKASKVKEYNFHVLRHTFATNCIKVGMDIKSLSEILGHASVDVTLNRYVHSSYDMKKKFLEKL